MFNKGKHKSLTKTILTVLIFAIVLSTVSVFADCSTVKFASTNFNKLVDAEHTYNISFNNLIDTTSVSANIFYLNNLNLTQADIVTSVSSDKKSINFQLSSNLINPGIEYTLDIQGLKDVTGKYIYVPKLKAIGAGNTDIDCSYYLLRNGNKYKFDGKISGTILGEAKIQNNTYNSCNYAIEFDVYNGNNIAKIIKGNFIKISSGDTETISATVDVNSNQKVFMHVVDANGNACSEQVEVTKKYTSNAKYLLEETVSEVLSNPTTKLPLMSGWNIDSAGGNVTNKALDYVQMSDTSTDELVSMQKDFLALQSGEFTVESSFCGDDAIAGFSMFIGGYRENYKAEAVQLVFTNGFLNAYNGIERQQLASFVSGKDYNIKVTVDINSKTYDVLVNSEAVATNFAFFQKADTLCTINITTTAKQSMAPKMKYLDVYTGYDINERFKCVVDNKMPSDWVSTNGVSIKSINSGRPNDVYSAILKGGYFEKDFAVNGNKEINYSFLYTGSGSLSQYLNDIEFTVSNGKFTVNNVDLCDIAVNVWYDIRLKYDNTLHKLTPYVNGVEKQSISCTLTPNTTLKFSGTGNHLIDDIYCKSSDTPTQITVDEQDDDGYRVHMISYTIWREGSHYGWDRILPYDERTPYLGWYDDGNVEAMNMQIKWLKEHNVDTLLFPFTRNKSNANNAVKRYLRDYAINDAYLNCELQDKINFAIMWSSISSESVAGSSDFRNNLVPYWIEHFFKNPNYEVIDGKPVLYIYDLNSLISAFGSEQNVKAEINYLSNQLKNIGFNGVYTIVSCGVYSDGIAQKVKNCGIDSSFLYSAPSLSTYDTTQIRHNNSCLNISNANNIDYVQTAYMGFDTLPWRNASENKRGAISPDGFENVLKSIKNNIDANKCVNIVSLGTWNEFGEGHYLMPSKKYGFAYLDAVKNVFSSDSTSHTDVLPNVAQKNSFGCLYKPNNSVGLYNSEDVDLSNLNVLHSWNFNSSLEQWTAINANTSISNGCLQLTPKNLASPVIINADVSSLGINADSCKYMRITLSGNWSDNYGTTGIIYFATDKYPTMNDNSSFKYTLYKDGMCSYIVDLSNNSMWHGNLKSLRIWPMYYSISSGKNMNIKIDSIEFLG